MSIKGFFVDWNGDTRRVERPGAGFICEVVERNLAGTPYRSVDVIDTCGFVTHEATYFESLEAVVAAGVFVNLTE